MKKSTFYLLIFIVLCGSLFVGWRWYKWNYPPIDNKAVEKLNKNYAREVEKVCRALELPDTYFKALIILESSADVPPQSRFEQHIYDKLKSVKRGLSPRYGQITTDTLQHFTDQQLKDMATSWGPLQVMGYHALTMGIPIEYLKNENSLHYGVIWCKRTYGDYLRKESFRDAFHIHNTGKPHPDGWFPNTHNPHYIRLGLAYMAAFE